jgi:hypothetical protein
LWAGHPKLDSDDRLIENRQRDGIIDRRDRNDDFFDLNVHGKSRRE